MQEPEPTAQESAGEQFEIVTVDGREYVAVEDVDEIFEMNVALASIVESLTQADDELAEVIARLFDREGFILDDGGVVASE